MSGLSMRRLSPTSPLLRATATATRSSRPISAACLRSRRFLALVHHGETIETPLLFSSLSPYLSAPELGPENDPKPDERTLKLGKTIRILHERLPRLLESPLPQEILSPQITLNLFPSTHPHLPTVSGRIAYTAALWTAPVAWGRMPVLGNVKLQILSERLVRRGGTSGTAGLRNERLVVKWKTCGKKVESGGQIKKIAEYFGKDRKKGEEFCGLFIFEFDEEGRIVNHTIEHTDEGGLHDQTAIISVTDWLLGRAWAKRDDMPGLALGYCENGQQSRRKMHRRQR